MDGWYEAETTVCQSCAATERAQRDSSDPEPGAKTYAVNTRDMTKKPLPERKV